MERWFVAVALLAYPILITSVSLRHEPWRDETDAWLAARDMTVAELFHWSHYAVTPLLWYLLIKPLTAMGLPYVSMQLLHVGLATLAAGMVLAFAPFARLTRLAICFSYLLGYEYAVVARNYAVLTLLTLLMATAFRHRYRRPWVVGLLLALMCSASLHGLCMAGAVGVAWGLEAWLTRRLNAKVWIGGAIAFLGGALAIAQVLPQPQDVQVYPPIIPPLTRATMTIQRAAFPLLPADWSRARSGLTGHIITAQIVTLLVMSFTLLSTLIYSVRRQPLVLLALAVCFGSLEYLFLFGWYGGDRHAGIIWLVFLTVVWILSRESRPWRLPALGRWLVAASLIFTFGLASWFWYQDWRYPFSGSTEAAAYLKSHLESDDVVAALSGKEGDDLLPFLPGRSFWYPTRDEFGTYSKFDRSQVTDATIQPVEALRKSESIRRLGTHFVFVSTTPLIDPELNGLRLVFQNAQTPFFHADELFFIYRGL